ncbi:hypothetical protein SAMN05444392_1127 [Seinonella peptonophila]|uniref:Polyketide cyclase / dehydrase and lipid transport n=1 Tax=Seinonella peptonophila TaxID=112248 RepID=A0A1M5A5P5_9BACL|nr:hypothetical protein [Seinonella peptonophila]SHF25152.1 hypothetical protein SAMN05444392_1127 [Seinonella peptonophila]
MNINRKILIRLEGIVEAPFEQISSILLKIPPTGYVHSKDLLFPFFDSMDDPRRLFITKSGAKKYTLFAGEEPNYSRIAYIEVDISKHMLAFYGGWWFGSEYHLSPHSKGCQITFCICNVASGLSRILLPFSKEFRSMFKEETKINMKKPFQDFLNKIAKLCNCSGYVVK